MGLATEPGTKAVDGLSDAAAAESPNEDANEVLAHALSSLASSNARSPFASATPVARNSVNGWSERSIKCEGTTLDIALKRLSMRPG